MLLLMTLYQMQFMCCFDEYNNINEAIVNDFFISNSIIMVGVEEPWRGIRRRSLKTEITDCEEKKMKREINL
jgi:hypothetical protein